MGPGYRSPLRQIPVHAFSNSSVVFGSSEILDDKQPTDDDWRHQLDNDNENFLQYEANDEDNDSWWLEAVRVVDDIENKQTKEEPSTMVSSSYSCFLTLTITFALKCRFLKSSRSTIGLKP